jgi:hypothetical protein
MTTETISQLDLLKLLNACGDAEAYWHLRYAIASGDFVVDLHESEDYTEDQCQDNIDHYRALQKQIEAMLSQDG